MPPANAIDAIQTRYNALAAWASKPDTLWFGSAWPKNAAGQFVSYGVIRFFHEPSRIVTTFAHQAGEEWAFRFEIFDQTPQLALSHFYGVMYGGSAPSVGAGFWLPASFAVPTNYVFKSFNVTRDFQMELLEGQFSPTGQSMVKVSWGQTLWMQYAE